MRVHSPDLVTTLALWSAAKGGESASGLLEAAGHALADGEGSSASRPRKAR